MATILNPTPVQPALFGGMWVRGLTYRFPNSRTAGTLSASLYPSDGTYLLSTGGKHVRESNLVEKAETDPRIATLLALLPAELNRLLGKEAPWVLLRVVAPDPATPVMVVATSTDRETVRVLDCFAKAGEDPLFATAFQTTMGIVASLAELEIE